MKEKEMEQIISTNLKKLLKEYHLNQTRLAKIAEVSESTVGKWILEKSAPRMGAIQKIADHFGLPKSYILEEPIADNLYPIESESIKVPILGEIACGDPIYAAENFSGYRTEPKSSLPEGTTYYLKTKGDSMEPTIPQNAYVLIREQPDVENGEIAAVLLNGGTEATLKRIRKQENTLMLMPDNRNYEPIIVNRNNPVKIIGKAIRYTFDL